MRRIALLVWLAAHAPAHATSLALFQKIGAPQEKLSAPFASPCDASQALDPAAPAQECIATEFKFPTIFSVDDSVDDVAPEASRALQLLPDFALAGCALLFATFILSGLRARRRHPVVRERVKNRRPMAWI